MGSRRSVDGRQPLTSVGMILLLLLGTGGGGVARATTAMVSSDLAQITESDRPKPAGPVCPQDLAQHLDAIAHQPQFARARWGALVQTQAGQTLYKREGDRYFLPASTAKLLTTAAALQTLGPQFRFRTTVSRFRTRPAVLRIAGSGDPSLREAQLQDLTQQLARQGIRQISQLIGDDSYYQGAAIDPTWEWEDIQAGYGAPVNSLILNQNAVELTLWPQKVGQPLRVEWADPAAGKRWRVNNRSQTVSPSAPEFLKVGRDFSQPLVKISGQLQAGAPPETVAVAVLDPAQHFLQSFQRHLATNGISVQQARINRTPGLPAPQILATVNSAPLATLLVETNQESNNLYAESLLRTLGTRASHSQSPMEETTAAQGLAIVQNSLTALGVDPNSYTLADGSGLSRHNLVSPMALVQTLQGMRRSPHAAIYQASLAVAGKSGTLQSRFQDTPVSGILRGKTGSMSGVAALAGYLDPPSFQPLVLSLIVNQADLPGRELRQGIDQMVETLARLRRC